MSCTLRALCCTPVGLLFALGIVSICANCAWRAKTVTYYAFDYPAPQREPIAPIPDTLMVYRFLLARSVPMESFMISESKDGEQTIAAYNWEENPADMITELVLRDLQKACVFDRTVDQLSPSRYRYALEGAIRELQGIIRAGKGSAILRIDVTFTDFEAPREGTKTLIKKDYLIEVPGADTKPESMMKALNLAVSQFSEQLRHDIRSAIRRGGLPDAKKCTWVRPGLVL
jgi:ABC-type uncharacterized transport system auxiliary subunit